ncbi:hypothetical protein BDF20DRAFT_989092 [Mycotypha africana]|uniref:uncharacterized protein n=1 Tax=Mycotypha africana TaxID=64632 RepID=UPI0023008D2C|nr:uncharacterized protein BDF20DRAFT_989092 [Mycotypha africana]KAI8975649.1 hypothetical protein BDF20DRAFT_989092 [Mycotypha africana]
MRGRGIEPRPFAWQAKIIPLNQPRFGINLITNTLTESNIIQDDLMIKEKSLLLHVSSCYNGALTDWIGERRDIIHLVSFTITLAFYLISTTFEGIYAITVKLSV